MLDDRFIVPTTAARGDLPSRRVTSADIEALGVQMREFRRIRQESPADLKIELLTEQLGVAEEELHTQHEEIVATNVELIEERRRYRELFELAPDAYLITDPAGLIVDANVAATALLGIGPHKLSHMPFASYVIESARSEFRVQLRSMAQRPSKTALSLTVRSSDGRHIDVAAAVAPILSDSGSCTGLRWLLRDVSRERGAERENERLHDMLERTVVERTSTLRDVLAELQAQYDVEAMNSRRKSEFLAFLSHEVRTPLQALIGYSEVLALDVHGPLTPAQRVDVERMQRAQQHMLRLIEDMLDYARIESGRIDLTVGVVALNTLCEGAVDLVRPLAAAHRVNVNCNMGEIAARADEEKVRQIVVNLLTNALKFGPAGGSVHVVARREEGDVVLSIEDEGTPLDASLRDLIFEPFVHLRRKTDGTGLGLPISRRLARAMNGDLTLAHSGERGNRFELRLPAA